MEKQCIKFYFKQPVIQQKARAPDVQAGCL